MRKILRNSLFSPDESRSAHNTIPQFELGPTILDYVTDEYLMHSLHWCHSIVHSTVYTSWHVFNSVVVLMKSLKSCPRARDFLSPSRTLHSADSMIITITIHVSASMMPIYKHKK